jgi:hypothetical protein
MKNVEVKETKEEGKVKKWVRKHKTGLSVATTAAVGIGLSALMHKVGYGMGHRTGWNEGYKAGIDFNASEVELLQSQVYKD